MAVRQCRGTDAPRRTIALTLALALVRLTLVAARCVFVLVQLGYGDGGEATVVAGGAATVKPITTYFRRTFTMPDMQLVTAVNVNILRDDGAVVYVNGQEVLRTNMPTGTIAWNTLAPVAVANADETKFYSFAVAPAPFVAGTNVIAVEVHQQATSSSDVSFDLEVIVSDTATPSPPPTSTFTRFMITDVSARCLDGTPAAYYMVPATGSGIGKWVVYHEVRAVAARSARVSASSECASALSCREARGAHPCQTARPELSPPSARRRRTPQRSRRRLDTCRPAQSRILRCTTGTASTSSTATATLSL